MLIVPLALVLTNPAFAQESPPPPTDGTATTAVPATGTPAAPSSAPTEADKAAALEGEFRRDLATVEQDVDKLKERVFRSKATLQLLKEMVLDNASLGSSIVLFHVNHMGAGYTIEEIRYFLDGKNVYARNLVSSGLADKKEMQVYEQAVPAGPHNLQVSINLRGNGFGVFSYLQSYSFKLESSYSFEVEDGQQTTVKVIADEKGGLWRTFVDRPNVEYETDSARLKGVM